MGPVQRFCLRSGNAEKCRKSVELGSIGDSDGDDDDDDGVWWWCCSVELKLLNLSTYTRHGLHLGRTGGSYVDD